MAGMDIKTGADELVELVKKRKKISIEEAAKLLGIKTATVQGIVDFLVEENKFGVEYKFTTPYVYLIEKKAEIGGRKESEPTRESRVKEDFFFKANERNLPDKMANKMWKKYLDENLPIIKDEFFEKAKKKDVPFEKLNNLWEKYKINLEEEK